MKLALSQFLTKEIANLYDELSQLPPSKTTKGTKELRKFELTFLKRPPREVISARK